MVSTAGKELRGFLAAELSGSNEPAKDIVNRLVSVVEQNEEWRRILIRRGLMWMLTEVTAVGRLTSSERDRVPVEISKRLRASPLINWRLETGKRLGDAVRADLLSSAASLEVSAAGSLSRAMLYRRLAAALATDETPVRRRFSNAQIKEEFRDCEIAASAAVGMVVNDA